jgi:hypothetical protein
MEIVPATTGRNNHKYYHEMLLGFQPHLHCHKRRGFDGDHMRDRENKEMRPDINSMPFLVNELN